MIPKQSFQLKFGSPASYDYDTILDQLSCTKYKTYRTSSIPLAQFWKNTDEKLSLLFNSINVLYDSPLLCFEYPTKPLNGIGKASMTDLMIINNNIKIAIEAKFTEYKKAKKPKLVNKWLFEGLVQDNRNAVLGYWKSLIDNLSKGISIDFKEEIEYQFFHRTASACKDVEKAFVVYQLFYDGETEGSLAGYIEKLKNYVKLINPNDNLKFYIWKIKISQNIEENKKQNPFLLLKNDDIYKIEEVIEPEYINPQ